MELSAFKRNNFILNKLLPCLLITMFAIMCLYGSRVYASSSTLNFSGCRSLTLDTSVYDSSYFNNRYIYIFADKNGDNRSDRWSYNLYSSCQPLFVSGSTCRFIRSSSMTDSDIYNDENPACYIFSASSSNNFNFTLSVTRTTYDSIHDFPFTTLSDSSYLYSLYSNQDINYYRTSDNGLGNASIENVEPTLLLSASDLYDSNENLVFQVPSQTQPTLVASQVGEVEMNKTLQEILGILPVVIVVLVGLIAIRKGIQFLIARMKKA